MKENCLTNTEKEEFDTNGYLLIPNALSGDEVARLTNAIDRLAPVSDQSVNVADILGKDDAFLDLIDCHTVFPKIWRLLGWNIWVTHHHFGVAPPTPKESLADFNYSWHRDGGVIYNDLKISPAPMLLIKVGFYLTDVSESGGATLMLTGSGRDAVPEGTRRMDSAKPITLEAGTAVMFDNRTLHSAQSPNTSAVTRKSVFIQYGYRWMQSLNRNTVAHLEDKVDDVRRQLLGLTTTFGAKKGRSGRYHPADGDVPLRRYVETVLGPDVDKYVARSTHSSELRDWD